MSTRNLIVSLVQKEGKKGSAMNSVFDNMNTVAAKIESKKDDKKKKK